MQLQVARIGKPHGIRGEVTVQVFTDDPEARFFPGAQLVAEPAANGPLTVSSARWNKQILVLGFEQVKDRNRAEELRGTQLFVEAEQSDENEEGFYEHDLEGLEAYVGSTLVGKVSELITGAAQDLLVITREDGTEVLIPFVEAIVPEVDLEAGRVLLTPPPGLLELADDAASEHSDASDERGDA